MNDVLMFLKESHIKWGIDTIDDFTHFGMIGEAVERPVLSIAFNQLNKFVSPKVPDDFKTEIHEALDKVVEGNYPAAVDEAFDVVQLAVEKIKKLDPVVREIAEALLKVIEAALVGLIEKKKAESAQE